MHNLSENSNYLDEKVQYNRDSDIVSKQAAVLAVAKITVTLIITAIKDITTCKGLQYHAISKHTHAINI